MLLLLIIINVDEIYQAKKDVIRLANEWESAIRKNNTRLAYNLRTESNLLKRNIKEKYQILL